MTTDLRHEDTDPSTDPDTDPDTGMHSTIVTAFVTVTPMGHEPQHREFTTTVVGNGNPYRPAYDTISAVSNDAQTWLESLRPKPTPSRVESGPQRGYWRRLFLALTDQPHPVGRFVPRQTTADVLAAEVGAPYTVHGVTVTLSVDSEEFTKSLTVGASTNGSAFQAGAQALTSVCADMRSLLWDHVHGWTVEDRNVLRGLA
jgi:hypothetical protein